MKAEDLMIGDWVKVHFGEHNETIGSDVCGQVAELYDDGRIEVSFNGSSSVYWNIEKERGDEILPIPLTPEILENNGIKPDNNSDGSYRIIKGMSICIDISNNGCFLCAGYNELEDINIYIGVHYVHELQHALKLCGIDKEIVMKPNQKIVNELFGEEQDKTSLIQIGNFKIRFLYDPCILIDGWKNLSIHVDYKGYNKGNFHIAVRKKWPFIKIGFRNIYPKLYKGGGF